MVAPTCPRCLSPLRFTSSGDCTDSTGGGTYRCGPCGFTTARDVLVVELLRRLQAAEDLLWRYGRASLPGFIAETFGNGRCPACEARWRAGLVDELERLDRESAAQ